MESSSRVSWQMHFIKGDATNCTATNSLKAHVLSVHSLMRVNAQNATAADGDLADDDPEVGHFAWENSFHPDLALCPPNMDGIATRALFYKQLKSCDAPTWIEPPPKVPDHDVHVRVFAIASDSAPDQTECRAIIEQETAWAVCTLGSVYSGLCVKQKLSSRRRHAMIT